jgi:hypothetical protein
MRKRILTNKTKLQQLLLTYFNLSLMRQIALLCGLLGVALHGWAQNDTTRAPKTGDTVRVGGIVIINKNENGLDGGAILRDSTGKHHYYRYHMGKNIETHFLQVDFGFDNYTDNTVYSSAATQALSPGATAERFSLRNGKSINFNLWFFTMKLNLIKHIVNLKYGLGIETHNYRYDNNIHYYQNPLLIVPDTVGYSKNKLATDFLTVPVMLNFNFTPHRSEPIGLSVGMSAGYMYSSRQKYIPYGGDKTKIHSDFNLESWRFSYIAELNLGPIGLYGELATKSMYKYGLDMTPYAVGIRLTY